MFLTSATTALTRIVRNIEPGQLDAGTPCAEFNVRQLLNHLLFWGPSLEGAARKESVPPPSDPDTDLTTGDWAADVSAQLERTAAAWSRPGAWEGTTHMGGPTELPASLVGGMVVVEYVVHAWDLAQATGQDLSLDEDLLNYVHEEVAKTADQGRQMGIYGPEVTMPPTASTLDRVLGLTGRDPAWR